MLNFKVTIDVGVETKNTQYPIVFDRRNVCIHCGAENTLIFVDKFGKETRKEIHPFDHIKCTKCGRNYSISWQKDIENGKMYPTAVERGIKQEFMNFIGQKSIAQKGVKEL